MLHEARATEGCDRSCLALDQSGKCIGLSVTRLSRLKDPIAAQVLATFWPSLRETGHLFARAEVRCHRLCLKAVCLVVTSSDPGLPVSCDTHIYSWPTGHQYAKCCEDRPYWLWSSTPQLECQPQSPAGTSTP